MTDLYKKRFVELQQQMEVLLASKKPTYNSFLEKNEIEIDSNSLLEWTVKARSLLGKACGTESEHYKEFSENDSTGAYGTHLATLERLRAIFLASKEDYEGGYLRTTRSLIQAEVFDSELEQASALFQAGYRLATLVMETYKSLHDLTMLLPELSGTKRSGKPPSSYTDIRRRAFVGMTRTSGLLCMALHKSDRLRDNHIEGFKNRGWHIIDLTNRNDPAPVLTRSEPK